MAALSIAHSFHRRSNSNQWNFKNRISPRTVVVVTCQSNERVDQPSSKTKLEKKENKSSISDFSIGIDKLGKKLMDNLSPKQKGDWKDLVLMSLSFAVYVYVSQQIVCAYCAWTSILKHSW